MGRRLKTYQTSSGFFDLAIAAPSMKAAAEAWGSRTNLFQQGLAKETHDPAIIAATMAKPGVVLRRPVGSHGPFSERAVLPEHLPVESIKETPSQPRTKTKGRQAPKIDDTVARKPALAFEREQKRRKEARRKEEAARAKERRRREQAIARAEEALERAKREHEARAKIIEKDRASLERRSQAEIARWEKQKERLEQVVRRAREYTQTVIP
jgi:colicin import membrane protein